MESSQSVSVMERRPHDSGIGLLVQITSPIRSREPYCENQDKEPSRLKPGTHAALRDQTVTVLSRLIAALHERGFNPPPLLNIIERVGGDMTAWSLVLGATPSGLAINISWSHMQ
ncbi:MULTISPECIES: hypothetical protein [unclassified Bradyrhizobium]